MENDSDAFNYITRIVGLSIATINLVLCTPIFIKYHDEPPIRYRTGSLRLFSTYTCYIAMVLNYCAMAYPRSYIQDFVAFSCWILTFCSILPIYIRHRNLMAMVKKRQQIINGQGDAREIQRYLKSIGFWSTEKGCWIIYMVYSILPLVAFFILALIYTDQPTMKLCCASICGILILIGAGFLASYIRTYS